VLISLLALPSAALAAGTFIDPCANTSVFVGPTSTIFICLIGANGSSTSGGTGVAGLDFFENHISPVHLSGFKQGDLFLGNTYEQDTSPTWNIAQTPTLLELDGSVKVAANDPNAYITLTLIGILGGCVNGADPGCVGGNQQLGPFKFGPGASTSLGIFSVVEQFTAPLAKELLIIDVSGNATYNVDGSPFFEAVPEPSTVMLFGAGSLLCALRMKLRRRS
jgi:hypothetical protein